MLQNRVNLIGRLGADPEVSTTESGKLVAKFSLATNEDYKDKEGNKVEKSQWHNIQAWGKTAELIRDILKKGFYIALEGKLVHSQYENKEGVKIYRTDIELQEFHILSSPSKEA